MKTIRLTLLLLAVSLYAGAQNGDVELAIGNFLATPGLSISESIVRERDLDKPGNPMKSMCEVWEFTCDAGLASKIESLCAQMTAKSCSEHCYYTKTHTAGRTDWHDILVGENQKDVVELGRSENSRYIIVNFLDTLDATKSHRYAYALEWQEQNLPFKLKEQDGKLVRIPVTEKTLKGKVVITYARMPQQKQQLQQEDLHEYNANIRHYKNGELLKSLRKKLKESDITELCKSMEKWIDDALEDENE